MTEVEGVALWVGLLAGVVSSVLAIVALVFTAVVERRSAALSSQMQLSLQKIEQSVERSSSDTSELIKVAWDRMLPQGQSGAGASEVDEESIRQIAAGVVAEAKVELEEAQQNSDSAARIEQLDEALARIERQLRVSLRSHSTSSEGGVDAVVQSLRRMGSLSRELLRVLVAGDPLSTEQYRLLRESGLAEAVHQLRIAGYIGPLRTRSASGESGAVYGPSGRVRKDLQAAMVFFDRAEDAAAVVAEQLSKVGYVTA